MNTQQDESLILCRDGNAICLCGPQFTAVPDAVVANLNAKFKYTLRKMGAGRGAKWDFTTKYLLQQMQNGRVYGAYGLATSLLKYLRSLGYSVFCKDCTPEGHNALKLEPDWSVLSRYTLRPRQEDCLRAMVSGNHGIIEAPMGFGKTTLLEIMVQLFPTATFHICTRSVAIANSIYTRLLSATPNIGRLGGGFNDEGKRVMVITADSLSKSDGNADFFIFDECHQAAAPTYQSAITKLYRYSRNYGLSATPTGRSDGADMVLTALFGDVLFSLQYKDGVSLGLVVPVTVRWLDCSEVPRGATQYKMKATLYRHCIWDNAARNELIAKDVQSRYTDDDQVLILVATVEHAVMLGKYLPDFTLVYGSMSAVDLGRYKNLGLLPSDYECLNVKSKNRLKEEFCSGRLKKVIATDVWNTGVDFPKLTVVYNATGRPSPILTAQGAGRVSRIFTGKSGGTVVDVIDTFEACSTGFFAGAIKRKRQYDKLGWSQEDWPYDRRR